MEIGDLIPLGMTVSKDALEDITPEMVEAGTLAYAEFSSAVEFSEEGALEAMLKAAYGAMRSKHPESVSEPH